MRRIRFELDKWQQVNIGRSVASCDISLQPEAMCLYMLQLPRYTMSSLKEESLRQSDSSAAQVEDKTLQLVPLFNPPTYLALKHRVSLHSARQILKRTHWKANASKRPSLNNSNLVQFRSYSAKEDFIRICFYSCNSSIHIHVFIPRFFIV